VSAIESFDKWGDAQLERLRGNPLTDTVFQAASDLGDFSGIWHLVSVARTISGKSSTRE
jgi:hypothetical protein